MAGADSGSPIGVAGAYAPLLFVPHLPSNQGWPIPVQGYQILSSAPTPQQGNSLGIPMLLVIETTINKVTAQVYVCLCRNKSH